MSDPIPRELLETARSFFDRDLMTPELREYWSKRGQRIGMELVNRLQQRRMQWQPYGTDGCSIVLGRHASSKRPDTSVLVSRANYSPIGDPRVWVHASISHPYATPTYDELAALHKAVFGEGHAYQVFVPTSEHVNLHAHALHLWGLDSGERVLPDFGVLDTI